MIAVMDHSGLRPFHGPTPTGFRFSVDSRFVAVPQFYVGVLRKAPQPIAGTPLCSFSSCLSGQGWGTFST